MHIYMGLFLVFASDVYITTYSLFIFKEFRYYHQLILFNYINNTLYGKKYRSTKLAIHYSFLNILL